MRAAAGGFYYTTCPYPFPSNPSPAKQEMRLDPGYGNSSVAGWTRLHPDPLSPSLPFTLPPSSMERYVHGKETLEQELYSRFVVVLNEKKAKIRALQARVKQLEESLEEGREPR